MKSFGDAVVAGKAPHGCNLPRPGVKRFAERDQLRQFLCVVKTYRIVNIKGLLPWHARRDLSKW